ncbi:MAG TPA: type VI secretion system baseplate subunit TssE [Bryobacteraceae bacterium]|jgi:type VI secretion system protein ImpF
MAAPLQQPDPALSLFDRLIDLDPESREEAPQSTWEQMREFQSALARDLTALLNTRRAAEDFDRRYQEAANSLLTFGIIDFTSYNLKSGPEQEQLRRSIERAIRQFEPRLARVSVSIEEPDPRAPALRLQISAVLRTPTAEPVLFPITVHRDSRRLVVSGGA